jgi:6-pyruvoyltetrahydropterin/6-carboxytetrahydropterin synthase
MVMDFQEISSIVKPMIEKYFDHQWINETLDTESPTAERIAQWIYEYLKAQIPQLYKVSVSETESCTASYFVS